MEDIEMKPENDQPSEDLTKLQEYFKKLHIPLSEKWLKAQIETHQGLESADMKQRIYENF